MLDTYFRSHFWTFHLVILALMAFCLAQTTNSFVALALREPAATIAAARSTPAPRQPRATPNLAAAWAPFLERNVFKAKREDLAPPPPAEASQQPDEPLDPAELTEDNCPASSRPTSLVTTIVAKNPAQSVAVFEDRTAKDVVVYRTGDVIQDEAQVVLIRRRNVYARHDNRCERFTLGAGDKRARPTPRRAARPAKRGRRARHPDLAKGVKKTGRDQYSIPRGDVDNILSNLNKVARQARIVPSFRNGKANGFKVFSIRPQSLFARLGMKNGDIIQRINGYDIDSPDKALAIYSKLKDAQSVSVDLLRRGRRKSLSLSIR